MEEYERCVRIWKNWVQSAPQEIELRLNNFQSSQAYHSVKLDYPDLAFSAVNPVWDSSRLVGYTGSLYAVVALANHKVACALLEDCLSVKEPLSVELICGVQHALSCGLYSAESYVTHEDRPGEFKTNDHVEGLLDVGASPDEVEEALESLVEEMPHIADMNDTLVAATYLHARLLFLKPFAVANGLVGRMMMNYWLRLQDHPPVVIHSSEAVRYKQCLEEFDIREDIEPLAIFLSEQITHFWSDQMSSKEERPQKPVFKLRL